MKVDSPEEAGVDLNVTTQSKATNSKARGGRREKQEQRTNKKWLCCWWRNALRWQGEWEKEREREKPLCAWHGPADITVCGLFSCISHCEDSHCEDSQCTEIENNLPMVFFSSSSFLSHELAKLVFRKIHLVVFLRLKNLFVFFLAQKEKSIVRFDWD